MNTIPTRSGCSACGTSPVNHRLARTLNIIDEVINKTVAKLSTSLRIPSENILADTLYEWFLRFLKLVGLVHFSTDPAKVASGRSELIWEEATRRGIRMEQIVFRNKHLDQYRAYVGNQWFYFESLPIPPWLSQSGYTWVDDKLALAHRLESAGIPVPRARLATSWSDTLRAFSEISKPIIIKPRQGSRGRHTTTNITTLEELRTAYNLAQEIARELVIEEHLFGSVCRATVVQGKLVGFFRTDVPFVEGNGVSTIAELISAKNIQRNERLGAIEINEDLVSFIARKRYALEDVLPDGVRLDLSAKAGRFYGGYTREMLPEIHPKMHTIFEQITTLAEAPVMGFDLITTDPTSDPDSIRWGIIECNSLPFIDLHYYALEGEPVNLAKNVWDLWENKS